VIRPFGEELESFGTKIGKKMPVGEWAGLVQLVVKQFGLASAGGIAAGAPLLQGRGRASFIAAGAPLLQERGHASFIAAGALLLQGSGHGDFSGLDQWIIRRPSSCR